MCFRHESEFEPSRRHAPTGVPPLAPPRWRARVAGVVVTAAAAVAAAFTLPDMLKAQPGSTAPQTTAAAPMVERGAPAEAQITATALSSVSARSSLDPRSSPVVDDEVAPADSPTSSRGGCHHD